MKKPMAPATFRRIQAAAGISNVALAKALHKSPQSISNYRTGYQAIVPHVAAYMKALAEKKPLKIVKKAGHKTARAVVDRRPSP